MISLDEIRRARERIGDDVLRTPLVQLDERIWLKLENLQPIGSFKLRGALSAVRAAATQLLRDGARIAGVLAETPDGPLEVRANITIAADGRECLYMQDTWLVTADGGIPLAGLDLRIW